MSKTVIAEGKTTNEAIENGLKQLRVPKDQVNVKVLESDDKRSFFSILAPRVVKVELTIREDFEKKEHVRPKREFNATPEDKQKAKKNIEEFMDDLKKQLPEGTTYTIETDEKGLNVNINSERIGFLIGYRGETLYALQTILASIASKGIEQKIRVLLDIEGYRAKRQKTLEDLADKIARAVVKTKKSITLEPMQPYERKIIHTKLQEHSRVETYSIGEDPFRKIVVSLKNK